MKIGTFTKPYSWTSKKTAKITTTIEKMITLTCDTCTTQHVRNYKHYDKMKTNIAFDKDYCNKCWIKICNADPGKRQKNRDAQLKRYEDPAERLKTSIACKGKNAGNTNAMKRPDIREKVSRTRTRLMKDPEFRAKFSQPAINAWSRGAYDNANTSGRAHWHLYVHSNGTEYRVQGKYELAFIKYLDKNNLTFDCHKGKIPYVADDGLTHYYFPDFYVHEWRAYADPKATHWYRKQYRKFELLAKQHPTVDIRILTEDRLRKLGINL